MTFVALDAPNPESETGQTAGTEVSFRAVRFRIIFASSSDEASLARLGPRCILTVP